MRAISLDANKIKKDIEKAYSQWKIMQKLGKGSFADVFLIEDKFFISDEEEFAALKVLNIKKIKKQNSNITPDEIILDALNEVRKQLSLSKTVDKRGIDGIVKVYGGHLIKGIPMIRMEYLEKGTLTSNISKLSLHQKINIISTLCYIVHILNKNHIFHRDIKPDNILLTKEFNPKLSDFGLAFDNREILDTFGGTRVFMAPEAISQNIVNEKTEIFSLGMVAYQLFTGFLPIDHSTVMKNITNNPFLSLGGTVQRKIAKSAIEKLKAFGLPRKIKEAIQISIDPEPAKRKFSVKELGKIFESSSACAYLTSFNSLEIQNGKVNKYSGPCTFRPELGVKIFFGNIKKNNKGKEVIVISAYGRISSIRKNRNKKNYIIYLENSDLTKLNQKITINFEQAKKFDLKIKGKRILKPKSQLKFLHPISWDAFDFINTKKNFIV